VGGVEGGRQITLLRLEGKNVEKLDTKVVLDALFTNYSQVISSCMFGKELNPLKKNWILGK